MVSSSRYSYDIFHSPGSSDSRGVAVLFNNDFAYKLINEKIDALGNCISLELEIDNKFTILLINIYGPNLDCPQFYSDINDIICASTSDFYILCGDFNLVQEFDLDCLNYRNLNNPRARDKLLELKNTHNLKDPRIIYNPQVRKFTWFKKNPIKKIKIRLLFYIRRITFCDE